MKTPSRKTLFGIAIAVAVLVTVLLVLLFRRRSKYQWPLASPTDAYDTSLADKLQGIQNTYNEEIIAAGTNTASIIAAEQKRSDDVRGAVNSYVGSKCPDATASSKGAVTAPNQTKWDTYQSDLNNIQQAYVGLLATPSATGYTNTAGHVIAARKADITGATRKYIASVCPDFYKPSTGSDPTASYLQWNYAATGTPTNNRGLAKDRLLTNSGTAAVSTGAQNLYAWTGYAANVYNVRATTLYAANATAGATFAIPITEDLTNKGMAAGTEIQYTYYTTTAGATSSTSTTALGTLTAVAVGSGTSSVTLARPTTAAFYVVQDTPIATGLRGTGWKLSADGEPNWKKARDAGPGSYPIPTWNAS